MYFLAEYYQIERQWMHIEMDCHFSAFLHLLSYDFFLERQRYHRLQSPTRKRQFALIIRGFLGFSATNCLASMIVKVSRRLPESR